MFSNFGVCPSVLNGGKRQRPRVSGSAHVVSALRPTELLDRYTAGCFFFASPTQTLLAEGCARLVCARAQVDPSALPGLVAEALAEDNGATVVVGAVPFSSTGETRLVIPERVLSGARLESDIPIPEEVRRADEQGVELLPEPDEYMRGIESALSELKCGQLRKVVLARAIEFKTSVSLDVRQLLRNLAWRDPGAYTFAVDLGEPCESIGTCRTIVGASPDCLSHEPERWWWRTRSPGQRPEVLIHRSTASVLFRSSRRQRTDASMSLSSSTL